MPRMIKNRIIHSVLLVLFEFVRHLEQGVNVVIAPVVAEEDLVLALAA